MKIFRTVFTAFISLLLIWLIFRGANWNSVTQDITDIKFGWLFLAEITIVGSMLTRVQRWKYIVCAKTTVTYSVLFNATQIGVMGNYILPGRLGEIIRALVLSRLSAFSLVRSIALVAFDRLTDLIALLIVLLIATASFAPINDIILPPEIYGTPIRAELLRTVAWGTAFISIFILVILILFFLFYEALNRFIFLVINPLSRNFAKWFAKLILEFSEGLQIFGRKDHLLKAFLFSLITWALMVLSYFFVFLSFDLETHWTTYFVLTAFLAIAISIPGAPGFVGQFHFAVTITIVALLPETDIDTARAVSIIAHLLNFIPAVVIGSFCLYFTKLDLFSLRKARKNLS